MSLGEGGLGVTPPRIHGSRLLGKIEKLVGKLKKNTERMSTPIYVDVISNVPNSLKIENVLGKSINGVHYS